MEAVCRRSGGNDWIDLMEVFATELWRYRISVPGLGAVVPPPPGATATVSQEVGVWLISQGYARPIGSQAPPPPADEWTVLAIALLEGFGSPDEIAAAIKGVGPETAKELFDLSRPLQWDAVRGVLNSRQADALRRLIS